jgi:hypothetical protein
MISIIINGGIKTVGTFEGTNNFKYCNPCIANRGKLIQQQKKKKEENY